MIGAALFAIQRSKRVRRAALANQMPLGEDFPPFPDASQEGFTKGLEKDADPR